MYVLLHSYIFSILFSFFSFRVLFHFIWIYQLILLSLIHFLYFHLYRPKDRIKDHCSRALPPPFFSKQEL